MNVLLGKAEMWLTELGIRTVACATCLKVSRDDIENLCGTGVVYDAFLGELRSALGTNKYYWSYKDDNWLYLDCW